nr:hypothetical protein [Tanacetum cinerariifolium]
MCEMTCQIVQKKLEEKQIEEEQAAKAQNQKLFVCYDDDDDEEESNSLKDNIISELPLCSAVTPSEPIDSLSMGNEHLDTISATESDEPSIKDDEDSEGDILFLERLLHDDPIPLPDTLDVDFSNVVRVFLPFFTYPVTSSNLLSSGSEDTIFDPGITINRSYSF